MGTEDVIMELQNLKLPEYSLTTISHYLKMRIGGLKTKPWIR